MRGKGAMIGSPSTAALAPSVERWLSGVSEAHAALEAAEAAAEAVRTRDAGFQRRAIPLLQRAEGFLVAARSSALAGRGRAATIFARIATEEFRAILRASVCSAVPSRSLRPRSPREIKAIPLPPEGPL
jgi:hypothetical protein